MKSIAATSIREAVRVRLNLPAFTTTGLITTTVVNGLIVQVADELAAMLRTGFGDGWNTTKQTMPLAANTDTIDLLPYGAIDICKVTWMRSINEFINLNAANVDRQNSLGLTPQSWSGVTPTYDLRGSDLEFYPAPTDDMLIMVEYTSGFNIASDLSTSIKVENGWDEWIINEVCARCQVRRNQDPSLFMQSAQRMWDMVIEPSFGRDEWKPQQVRDVMGRCGLDNDTFMNGGRYYRGF